MTPAKATPGINTICLLVIAAIAIGGALHWLAPMMIPFTLALFCTFVLTEVADILVRKLRFPRSAAIASAVLLALLVFFLMATMVSSSVNNMASNVDVYKESTRQMLNNAAQALPLERMGLDRSRLTDLPVGSLGNTVLSISNAILGVVRKGILVLIFVLFMIIGWQGDTQHLPGVWGEIQHNVRRFLAAKTLISAATGTLVGGILWFLDVDLALVFGLFAFLLNFIPSIGSIIATLLPLPLVLIDPSASNLTVILALAVPGAIQISIGNFLEPKIMGDSLDMHPVTILLSLIFWGMLWGVVGAFLATPITVVIKILLSKHDHTRPVADLMGGNLKAVFQ